MSIAFNEQAKTPRVRSSRDEATSAKDVLEQAHALATEIEGLLTSLSHEVADTDTFRVRLARAHTLSLLDQLCELIGTRPSDSMLPAAPSVGPSGPAVHGCGAPQYDVEENATSGVRLKHLWR